MREIIDIAAFERSSDFYPAIDLLLTVKSFDLAAIRRRYLHSRQSGSGRAGSVERRNPGKGGIVSLRIEKGKIRREKVVCRLTEPRGIDLKGGKLAIAAENKVYCFGQEGSLRILRDPWFAYIHTVRFHPGDTDLLLISSSGLDMVKEYRIDAAEPRFEWLAWEHGYALSRDPASGEALWLTRSAEQAAAWHKEGKRVKLLQNPANDHLPTAMRAAFINSADYAGLSGDKLIATFFHEGKVVEIDRASGTASDLLTGLKNPHGGHVFRGEVRASSTGAGEIVRKTEGNKETALSFRALPGKAPGLGDLEWIQNSISLDHLLLAIDSNRTAFVIINPGARKFDMIAYNQNWAVQDLISGRMSEGQERQLRKLDEPAD